MSGTSLIFKTQPGSLTIPANSTVVLTKDKNLSVKEYYGIRLACGSRISSTSPVTIKLIMVDGNMLTIILDSIVVKPFKNFTKVYEIPGTALSITATAGNGDAYIDLYVYGYSNNSKAICY